MTNVPSQPDGQVLGPPGEACSSCGTPLNQDQRYCLSCGARRDGMQPSFIRILGEPGGAQAPPGASATSGASQAGAAQAGAQGAGSSKSPIPALATIGCLLLALGVGVVIGRSGGSGSSSSKPQVVNLGAAGTAAGTAATADAASTDKKGKSSGDSGSASSASASKATNSSIANLEKLSPKDYQKQAAKLPKLVGTGGKPPPTDNKAPAGGGSFTEIK